MKLGSRRTIVGLLGTTVVWVLGVVLASGQAAQEKPQMAEDVFKNVQVLRGIPVDQFMETMGIFSASLGMSCEDCHAADDTNWENYAKDSSSRKQRAREMVLMVNAINKDNFQGRQVVGCYSCHRGGDRPKLTPSLAAVYGAPVPEEPDGLFPQAPGAPPADQILDKYLQALGGTQRLAKLTSFVAKGTSAGYGPENEKRPVEIYARATGQRTTIIHTGSGDATSTFDGRAAWVAAPHRPVPVLALTGHELDAAKLNAGLSFPAQIKQALNGWHVGFPATINDRRAVPVQGTSAGGAIATLYFDEETGLLVRLVHFADSPVGRSPTQIDYADYRDVAGVKMPFRWTVTWLDGRETFELSGVQPNVAIDAARFARPAPPKQ
jgi:hypothetical protein